MSLADQIVVEIVQRVSGWNTPITSRAVAEAAIKLASPANGPAGQALALFCEYYHKTYRNWNYESETNGERWLLGKLATFQSQMIFDVGANLGNWLFEVRSAMPAAEIHAFEIVEATSTALAARVVGQTGIVVNPFGLADQSGNLIMRVYFHHERSSCTAYPYDQSYREVACPVRTGDEYLRDNGISHIDCLKIDVEGAEHLVLKGFAQALRDGRIDVIQFEYGQTSIFTHHLLRDFYEQFEANGYAVGKLFPDHVDFRAYKPDDEDFIGPNYVAVTRGRFDIIEALKKP